MVCAGGGFLAFFAFDRIIIENLVISTLPHTAASMAQMGYEGQSRAGQGDGPQHGEIYTYVLVVWGPETIANQRVFFSIARYVSVGPALCVRVIAFHEEFVPELW